MMGIAIGIVLFRFIITGVTHSYSYSRLLIPLPLLVAVFLCVRIYFPLNRKHLPGKIEKIILVSILLTSIYWSSIFIKSNAIEYSVLLEALSTEFLMFFLLYLIRSNLDVHSIYKTVGMLSYFIIWIGSALFIITPFFMDANEMINFLYPISHQLAMGSSYVMPRIRRAGFLLTLVPSAVAISAATIFFITDTLNQKLSADRPSTFRVVSILLGSLGVLMSTSFTTITGLFFSLFILLLFTSHKKISKRSKFFMVVGSIFFTRLATLLPPGEQLVTRMKTYIDAPSSLFNAYIPKLECSMSSLIWNNHPLSSVVSSCSFGELHVFSRIPEVGLVPELGWLFSLLIPAYFLTQYKGLSPRKRAICMFTFAFTFSALHYSGAEAWGNNYLYLFALAALLKTEHDSVLELRYGKI